MNSKIFGCLLVCSVAYVFFSSGCGNKTDEEHRAEIAVTNSYLGCAVLDLCGEETEVLCLAPPGMCPGHFDISPTQVKQLCDCKILFLFDFQKQVEGTLSRVKERGLKTALVGEPGGLCVPDTYLATCRRVSEILSSEYPDKKAQYQQRLDVIENDLKLLKQELSEKIQQAGIASAKVLASYHQDDFANWLGLETVATFIGSDTETVAGIDRCIKQAEGQTIRFVIANQQEGTALAKALAERLGARAVVFGNFPEMRGQTSGYPALLRANVDALIRANSGDSIEVAKQ
ncbi:MAG: zinc ABC transporter substrate-binding protein [Sedimentisphaerales bacterium]|nr:zinc ABC transporter substrate-binding protein [Sedimentisphaerales bacterium]